MTDRTTAARDALDRTMELTFGIEPHETAAFFDAYAAEVCAAALFEAADDLEAVDFHPKARGNYRGIAKAFAFRLRAKAAAARPDNTGA